ncbi:MAG TPA: TonB-dependent siderophore receptor [Vicinamibacteria bacterium]|nr:TonB-dependent siderophore receptor [Vicinamibacteria bacterium]
MLKNVPALVLVLILALAGGARGDQQKDDPDKPPPTPQLTEYVYVEGSLRYVPRSNTIVTKLPLDRRSTPNNVGVVTEPLVREQFDRVLGDALVNVSNVNIQSQNGVHDFFLIRGFDSLSSGLVLVDGASEPEATFFQLYNVDLVEVLKGPGGFLYGSNPLAGAVNLVRKQPVPAQLFRFSGSAGSFDSYEGSFDMNLGTLDQPVSFRLNGLVRDVGSHRDGKEGRTLALNPAFGVRFAEKGTLNVNFEYLDLDFVPDSGIPVVGDAVAPVDPGTSYQTPLDTSQQEILRFQIDYEWPVNDWLTLRDKFYRRDLDWISDATILAGVIPTGPTSLGVIRSFGRLDDAQGFTGNQLEAILAFETGSVRHSLLTGFELARFADQFALNFDLLPIVDLVNPIDPGLSPFPGFSAAGDARSIVAAPYVIDQIQIGPRWNVLMGARVDVLDFDDQVSGAARNDTEVSPMTGISFSPRTDLSVYGNFSRSFAPPSPRVVGELVPERGTQYEAGIKKHFPGQKAEMVFAVYQLERDNIPIPDDNGFTQQVGNQRSRGFEIDFAAEPTTDFRAFVSYALNDSELTNFAELTLVSFIPPTFELFDRSGNRPAFAPKHVLNFWLSKEFGNWGVGGGGRYLSSQFIAENNEFSLDSVMTFDATVFYDLGGVRLRLNIKNLTDEEYYLRGFGGNSVIPAPPFGAYFGFDWTL